MPKFLPTNGTNQIAIVQKKCILEVDLKYSDENYPLIIL